MIQPLNYPASAARSLREFIAEGISKNCDGAFDSDILACKQMLAFLEMNECQHFQMPKGGHIFNDKLKGIQGRPIRLPHRLMSISYYCGPEDTELRETYDGSDLIPVPKRLAIAIELPREQLPPTRQNIFPGCQRICAVMAIFSEDKIHWKPCMSVAFFPTDKWDGTGYEGEMEDVPSMVKTPGGHSFIAKISVLLPHHYKTSVMLRGKEWTDRALYHDIGGEVSVLLELCEALTCTNVRSTVIQKARPELNARRVRDGKLPILETRILTLDLPISRRVKTPHQGGTHATPIGIQLCRGHIRGWPNDPTRNIWIDEYARGTGDVIKKTYQVRT